MDSIISTFHIDWHIIVAQAINFAIVLGVLYFYALKPLSQLMSERSAKISQGLEDAKKNGEMLQMTKKEYEEVLAKARLEANVLFKEGKQEAENKRAKMLEEAKIEVDAMIKSGKQSLLAEKEKMVAEASKEVVTLAVQVAEKLLASKEKAFSENMLKELNNL